MTIDEAITHPGDAHLYKLCLFNRIMIDGGNRVDCWPEERAAVEYLIEKYQDDLPDIVWILGGTPSLQVV
jgi:hypothetical protein